MREKTRDPAVPVSSYSSRSLRQNPGHQHLCYILAPGSCIMNRKGGAPCSQDPSGGLHPFLDGGTSAGNPMLWEGVGCHMVPSFGKEGALPLQTSLEVGFLRNPAPPPRD